MSESLRRIYNRIEQAFDWGILSQELHYSHKAGNLESPQTAGQVFQLVRPLIRELDRHAQLKMVVSQQGLDQRGTSAHWEFFFVLVRRRAEVVCEWILPWDEDMDNYGQASITIWVKPFPAADSPLRMAVRDGKLLYQQMKGLWLQECRRRPTLTEKFHDTDIALADFVRQGLDIAQSEFSVSTGQSPQGKPCWVAQTKNDTYYSPLG